MTDNVIATRFRRFSKWFAMAAVGLLSLGVGASLVSANLETKQPEGTLLSWQIEGSADALEPLLVDESGVPLRFQGGDGRSFPITVVLNDGSRNRTFIVSVTPDNGLARLPLPAWFTGCQLAQFQTEGLPTLGALVTDGSKECPSSPQVRLFEQFGIPTGQAPTTSVRELLAYLSDVSARVNLDRLPPGYRACLERVDPEIQKCLASLDLKPLALEQ